MEDSKPKWVNSILNIIGVNSSRLGEFHLNHDKVFINTFALERHVLYLSKKTFR